MYFKLAKPYYDILPYHTLDNEHKVSTLCSDLLLALFMGG